jgi:hypothetical protein
MIQIRKDINKNYKSNYNEFLGLLPPLNKLSIIKENNNYFISNRLKIGISSKDNKVHWFLSKNYDSYNDWTTDIEVIKNAEINSSNNLLSVFNKEINLDVYPTHSTYFASLTLNELIIELSEKEVLDVFWENIKNYQNEILSIDRSGLSNNSRYIESVFLRDILCGDDLGFNAIYIMNSKDNWLFINFKKNGSYFKIYVSSIEQEIDSTFDVKKLI